MEMDPRDVDDELHFLEQAAYLSCEIIQSYFGKVQLERKELSGNRSSTVTKADIATQDVALGLLRECDRTARVYAEEDSRLARMLANNTGKDLYYLDPIDGTNEYAAGTPFYGFCMARVRDGKVRDSVILHPHPDLRELFLARAGDGATLNHKPLHTPQPCATRVVYVQRRSLFKDLAPILTEHGYEPSKTPKCSTYQFTRVAKGDALAVIMPSTRPYDVGPGCLIVEEAGGYVRDMNGETISWGEDKNPALIAAASKEEFEKLAALMKTSRESCSGKENKE